MFNFFRGWKRKVGCVTLLTACVFAAGWVRSIFVTDTIDCEESHIRFGLLLIDQHIVFQKNFDKREAESIVVPASLKWTAEPFESVDSIYDSLPDDTAWRFSGFGFIKLGYNDSSLSVWVVWSFCDS